MVKLKGFKGQVFQRDTEDPDEQELYKAHRYQYASSSHSLQSNYEHMAPALILYPQDVDDIIFAIKYARERNIAIAVRSGGHQYSGASSTEGPNIQLDLSETFAGDLTVNKDEGTVRVSVSYRLEDFNLAVTKPGLLVDGIGVFVPHGQCSHVHIGGHVQTGGYGQLGRAFGLFGDHVVSFDIVTADGNYLQNVTAQNNKDLFYAVLGGSPGNFGVLTHVTIKPHKDSDHPHSRGLKCAYFYKQENLQKLLDIMVEMDQMPGDFDLCITVLTAIENLTNFYPSWDSNMKENHLDLYGQWEIKGWPSSIMVYAQWANLQGADDPYEKNEKAQQWFQKIKEAGGVEIPFTHTVFENVHTPMSKLTHEWIFHNVREYDLPYEKRTYMTKATSTELESSGWTKWVSSRINEIQTSGVGGTGVWTNCKLSVQIQNFGGSKSAFFTKRDNGTSYGWRDSTVCAVLDCFYTDTDKGHQEALAWQKENDDEGVGPNGVFSKQDRRVFWGSYSKADEIEGDLNSVWSAYYESREKYDRLIRIKRDVDSNDVFTPNLFALRSKPVEHLLTPSRPPGNVLMTMAFAIGQPTDGSRPAAPLQHWDDKQMLKRLGRA